ncbi:MAG: LysR substrate-binding domain-containing protein [Pseudorhodobacter sp.]|nr:LysR substrate-binding domain-containing protein [Pseudorhodobacter sp.]
MNIREFKTFRAVMLAGTTTGAAKILFISQPAVSRHISSLEEYCGVKLFDRKGGRLRPTAKAEMLLSEFEFFQEGVERLDQFATRLNTLTSQHLRIIATSPMAHGLLPQALTSFHRNNPGSSTSLYIVPRRKLRGELEMRPFDVGIVTLPIPTPLGECTPLTKVEGVCILPQGHRLEKRTSIGARDLAGENFVCASPNSPTRHMIDQELARKGVACKNICQSHSALSICDLVASGIGLSVVDPFTARLFVSRGISIVPFKPALYYEFGIIFPANRPHSRLAETLATSVRELVENVTCVPKA